ncbi:radical SAM protein [Chloroflexota bacterium]
MKYIFGPVPSRRLGQSLGIDPIPFKTCNWNCVYCQLGRTSPLALERGEYVPRQDLIEEVRQTLQTSPPGKIDWITIVGSGEPTLHEGLGWMIRQVKTITNLPVAVITNGSLMYLPEVREELSAADAVLPTLDAGNPKLYRQINRAAPRFTFDRLVNGIVQFRQMYSGKLWVEIMLVKDMNDGLESLEEIAKIMERMKPDLIQITLPVRPPAESKVKPAEKQGLELATRILGEIAPVSIPSFPELQAISAKELSEAIISIVTRHPMQEGELLSLLNSWPSEKVYQKIMELSDARKIQKVVFNETTFWNTAAANFKRKNAE